MISYFFTFIDWSKDRGNFQNQSKLEWPRRCWLWVPPLGDCYASYRCRWCTLPRMRLEAILWIGRLLFFVFVVSFPGTPLPTSLILCTWSSKNQIYTVRILGLLFLASFALTDFLSQIVKFWVVNLFPQICGLIGVLTICANFLAKVACAEMSKRIVLIIHA